MSEIDPPRPAEGPGLRRAPACGPEGASDEEQPEAESTLHANEGQTVDLIKDRDELLPWLKLTLINWVSNWRRGEAPRFSCSYDDGVISKKVDLRTKLEGSEQLCQG